jgi:dTMP kinase
MSWRNTDGHDGVFIVFEGIDGAGTTTQAERYAAHLRSRKRMVRVTREPSGGPVGSLIRLVLTQRLSFPAANNAETMALLFAADRLDHNEVDIAPHLRDGSVVISDRYDLSSLAYQSATVLGLEGQAASEQVVRWIRELNKHAMRPDVTVVLDVSPAVADHRRRVRGGMLELFDDADLQARLAQAYRGAEALVPGDRVVHVDGDGTPDEVAGAVAAALAPFVETRSGRPEPM